MSTDVEPTLTPKLRFPEFRSNWTQRRLDSLAVIITERAGDKAHTPFTVTTGVGLVSQQERFGRTIAGNAFRNYFVLRKNDFAYNKSATKAYPQGYIARFLQDEQGAVPNSIFTCFSANPESVNPAYLDYLFAANLHGRWLRRYIEVSARAHGSLSVSDDALMSLPVPVPDGASSLAEQQKIADCLTSLDKLIAAQGRKVEALKAHRNGLMQQLFPREGETLPRLRFPEFRNAPEWETDRFANLYNFQRNNALSRDKLNYESGSVKNVHYGDIHTKFQTHFDITRENVPYINHTEPVPSSNSEEYCVEGDLIFADASEDTNDVGKCIELVKLNGERLLSGQHTILARRVDDRLAVGFGAYLFRSKRIRSQIEKEAQGTKVYAISATRLSNVEVALPTDAAEQQRIADCLYTLDAHIAADSQKLTALKTHKKGLMQQLFPSPEGD